MKLSSSRLKKLIQEELARGIPDFSLSNISQNSVDQCAEELFRLLIVHVNQTSKDPSTRNKKYGSAARIKESLKRDREFVKLIEDKLKEQLLVFLDDSR